MMKVYMFHYVTKNFNYYHFDADLFEKTIVDLMKDNNIISYSDFIYKFNNNLISENDILLTFDDGTIDHYEYVYKILKKYNLSGLFFISSASFNNKVLDVQFLHRLISCSNIDDLYDDLINYIDSNNINVDIKLNKTFDDYKMAYFKQVIQSGLSYSDKENIIKLFSLKYNVSLESSDYYVSKDKLIEMKNNNMFFGIHTVSHPRLSLLSKNKQLFEIKSNIDDLNSLGIIDSNNMAIAFPFGDFNDDTLSIMDEVNIKFGFTVSNTKYDNSKLIGRIDCKYLRS